MKKLISLLLAVAVFFSLFAFVSCEQAPREVTTGEPGTQESSKPDLSALSEDAQTQLDSLPEKDFCGADFRIATDDVSLIMPSGGSNLINQKIYLRNQIVEKKYNIKIKLAEDSGLPTIYDRVRAEALAGTDFCDLALLKVDKVQLLVSDDALYNLHSVPFLDLSAPYFFADAVNATTIGSNTYALGGDFTFDPSNIFVLYFNQYLLEKAGLPDLYQLIEDKQWDFENFLIYCEEVYALDRVDGWKVYGFGSPYNQETLSSVFWAASGLRFLDNTYSQRPKLIYNHETTRSFLDQADNILYHSPTYFSNVSGTAETFSKGRILFCIAPLSDIESITTNDFSWGIAPMPKLDINQENYYSYMQPKYQLACIPKGVPNLSMSGVVTSALFASSYNTVVDSFLTLYLNSYLTDQNSGYTLKEAISVPYYDPAYFFGEIETTYSAATYTLVYRVLSTDAKFDDLYKSYSRLFETYLDNIHLN